MRLRFISILVAPLLLLCEAVTLRGQETTKSNEAFRKADKNEDGQLSFLEFREFMRANQRGDGKSPKQVFAEIDGDRDRLLTPAEFRAWLAGPESSSTKEETEAFPIPDPGPGYVLFSGLDQPIDDAKVYASTFYRTVEMNALLVNQPSIKLNAIPKRTTVSFSQVTGQSGADLAFRATVIFGGGKTHDDFFTGGGVVVSPDGLCLTNYHIAKYFNEGLTVMLADGRSTHPVEFVAANREMDLALLRLDGKDFPWVPLARSAPAMADEIKLVHHSENRFFTFDRGYVKRYPRIGGDPWMEVSAPFAPGGSGCGVFNSKWELVGLVCVITVGDGPAIALDSLAESDGEEEIADDNDTEEDDFGYDFTSIVVRLAAPWSGLKEMFSDE